MPLPTPAQGAPYTWSVNADANGNPLSLSATISSAATLSSVASSSTSTTLLAANNNRKGAYIYNDSVFLLYIAFANAASSTAYTVQVAPGSFYEMPTSPTYQGVISGIWSFVNGNARITELT